MTPEQMVLLDLTVGPAGQGTTGSLVDWPQPHIIQGRAKVTLSIPLHKQKQCGTIGPEKDGLESLKWAHRKLK